MRSVGKTIAWKTVSNVFNVTGHRRVDAKLPSLTMEPKRPETRLKGDFIILLQNVLSCVKPVKPVKREVVEFFADE